MDTETIERFSVPSVKRYKWQLHVLTDVSVSIATCVFYGNYNAVKFRKSFSLRTKHSYVNKVSLQNDMCCILLCIRMTCSLWNRSLFEAN